MYYVRASLNLSLISQKSAGKLYPYELSESWYVDVQLFCQSRQSPEAVILAATHHLKQRAFDKAVLFVGPDSPMTLTHMSLQQRSIAFQTLVESRGLYASICGFDQVSKFPL